MEDKTYSNNYEEVLLVLCNKNIYFSEKIRELMRLDKEAGVNPRCGLVLNYLRNNVINVDSSKLNEKLLKENPSKIFKTAVDKDIFHTWNPTNDSMIVYKIVKTISNWTIAVDTAGYEYLSYNN